MRFLCEYFFRFYPLNALHQCIRNIGTFNAHDAFLGAPVTAAVGLAVWIDASKEKAACLCDALTKKRLELLFRYGPRETVIRGRDGS